MQSSVEKFMQQLYTHKLGEERGGYYKIKWLVKNPKCLFLLQAPLSLSIIITIIVEKVYGISI